MLISLEDLKKEGIDCAGMRILHVGACRLEELPAYNAFGITDIIWIEARPDVVREMRAKYPDQKILQACVGSVTGKTVTFDTHHLEMCSSVFRPTTHLKKITRGRISASQSMQTVTLTDLFARSRIQRPFDMLNIDVQGSELEALKGFPDEWWPHVKLVYLEINAIPQYEGSCTPEQLDAFLKTKGFVRKCERWCGNAGFADAAYVRA